MTSVVIPTASANRLAKNPATSTFLQPSLGVIPILPKLGDSGRSSNGPKHASPIALNVPCLAFQSRKIPSIRRSVAAASLSVLSVMRSRMSSGAVPTRHSHFVPPSSTPHIRRFGVIGALVRRFWAAATLAAQSRPAIIDDMALSHSEYRLVGSQIQRQCDDFP